MSHTEVTIRKIPVLHGKHLDLLWTGQINVGVLLMGGKTIVGALLGALRQMRQRAIATLPSALG